MPTVGGRAIHPSCSHQIRSTCSQRVAFPRAVGPSSDSREMGARHCCSACCARSGREGGRRYHQCTNGDQQAPCLSTTMEGMLIHDDDRSRQTERLVAELSSELCATDPDDLDALIETILPRIGEATRADSVALVADGVGDSERRTYRYASAMDGADAETATSVQTPALWEHLEVDAEPLLLERIPAD